MTKTIKINVEETLVRLNAWLSKVEPCYRDEVEQAMNNFKIEYGLNNN